jgi:hypothetical protein
MPLKHFLRLFEPTESIKILALGDTMHPSSGYVDERIVSGVERVAQLCAHAYDFEGLIHFEATVAEITIKYADDQYLLAGNAKQLATLQDRIRALNAASKEQLFIVLKQ